MIERTFLIAKGIGKGKESRLWSSGINTWNDFMESNDIPGVKDSKKAEYDLLFAETYDLLDDRDCYGLGEMLPPGEQWRLYGRFHDDVAYLDIETDGLERDSTVPVVTIHKKDDTTTLTCEKDLDAGSLSDALDGVKMLVTFNGRCFDVPVLKNSFPTVDFDMPHFDLRFGCRKAGLPGGLKKVEVELGLKRDDDISDIDGEEAVRLWKSWKKNGDSRALELLTEYNRADTVNLVNVAEETYDRLVRQHGF